MHPNTPTAPTQKPQPKVQTGAYPARGHSKGADLARLAGCAHWGLVEWHRGVDGARPLGDKRGTSIQDCYK